MDVVDAKCTGDREHDRREQNDRRQSFQDAAKDHEDQDRHDHIGHPAARQIGDHRGQLEGKAALRQPPGHGRCAAEDQQDRPGKGCRLDQHGIELFEADAAIKHRADDHGVEHGDSGHFGCRRHAAAHQAADEERQNQRRGGNQGCLAHQRPWGAPCAFHVLMPRLPAGQNGQHQKQHHGNHETGGEQTGNRYARRRTENDQHDGWRNRIGHGRTGGQKRDHFLGLVAAALHFRKQRRCDGRHIRDLGAGNARDQKQRAEQHVRHAGADMAEHRGQELDDRLAHAGGIEHTAQQHENRHRQQNDARHALIHTPDHHDGRNPGGEGQVGEGSKTEAEGDRHAQHQKHGHEQAEEDRQIEIAEGFEHRRCQIKQAGSDRDSDNGHDDVAQFLPAEEIVEDQQQHKTRAKWQSRSAESHGNIERGRGDHPLLDGIFDSGLNDRRQKCRHQHQGK
ncbi:hypothetical protein D3C80_224580 [compost metagenome]